MIGAHMPKNDEFTLSLLTNADVLAVEKESYCGHQIYRTDREIAWIAPRIDGEGCYLAVFNISEEEIKSSIALRDYNLEQYVSAKELWSNETTKIDSSIESFLEAHSAKLYLLK